MPLNFYSACDGHNPNFGLELAAIFSSAYELLAQAELLRSPVVQRLSILLSLTLLTCHKGFVDTLRDWVLPIIKLSHSDLLCGFL